MKQYIKFGVIFLSIMQILCGCQSNKLRNKDQTITAQGNPQYMVTQTDYTGYFQKERELSMYEPITGSYLGAYVLANPEIEFDITQFERAVGRDVAVALRYYQIGDPFPHKWLLECLANKKAPHMVITPNNMKAPYDQEALLETAKAFQNTYGIPVFAEFYPGGKAFGDPAQYISYFQFAKEVFAQHAPNVALVWSMDMEDLYDSMIYYPGDDYVDWIGINMEFPIYKNNEKYKADIEKHLDYFYNMYQDKKPLMISRLAISHYSKKDHAFYLDEAEDTINQIYSQIPLAYPRIKAVNYIDTNDIKMAPDNTGTDNFRVSVEPKITEIYKAAIKGKHYLEDVEEPPNKKAYQWMKMRTPIYKWNNELYVLEDTIAYDWSLDLTDQMKDVAITIDDEKYYHLGQVAEIMNYKYAKNENKIRIYK